MKNNKIIIKTYKSPPKNWDNFIRKFKGHKLYHTTKWIEFIGSNLGHPTYYIIMEQGDDQWIGCLPLTYMRYTFWGKLLISLPYVNYGGPLLKDDRCFFGIIDYLNTFREKLKVNHIELRMNQLFEMENLQVKAHKVTYLLALPENDNLLWKTFKAKLRNQIRRPLKERMFVRKGGVELVNSFYRVFAHNMRDLGTPVYNKKFFRDILTYFPNDTFLVVVFSREDIPVAASFLIRHGDTMEIPWASSLRGYNRFSPNMLLYWESFRLAIEKQCKFFDFGRCTPGSGTCRFKKQWGAEEKPLYWYYVLPVGETLPETGPSSMKFEFMIKLWQRMPLIFANIIGPHIIRNIPG